MATSNPNIALHVKITEKNNGTVKVEFLCKDADDPTKRYPMRYTHVRGLLLTAAQIIGMEAPEAAKPDLKDLFGED